MRLGNRPHLPNPRRVRRVCQVPPPRRRRAPPPVARAHRQRLAAAMGSRTPSPTSPSRLLAYAQCGKPSLCRPRLPAPHGWDLRFWVLLVKSQDCTRVQLSCVRIEEVSVTEIGLHIMTHFRRVVGSLNITTTMVQICLKRLSGSQGCLEPQLYLPSDVVSRFNSHDLPQGYDIYFI